MPRFISLLNVYSFAYTFKRAVRFRLGERGLLRREPSSNLGDWLKCNSVSVTLDSQMLRTASPLNAPAESGQGAKIIIHFGAYIYAISTRS